MENYVYKPFWSAALPAELTQLNNAIYLPLCGPADITCSRPDDQRLLHEFVLKGYWYIDFLNLIRLFIIIRVKLRNVMIASEPHLVHYQSHRHWSLFPQRPSAIPIFKTHILCCSDQFRRLASFINKNKGACSQPHVVFLHQCTAFTDQILQL